MGSQVSMVDGGGHAGDRRGRAGADGLGLVDPGNREDSSASAVSPAYAIGFGGVGALLTWRRPEAQIFGPCGLS
jgi:hypothetical protein